MFLIRKRFWFTVLKLAAFAFPVALVCAQIPELRYDLGPVEPVQVTSPDDLARFAGTHSTFVVVAGRGDFDKAFIHKSHGQSYAYFVLEPFGRKLIVRSFEKPIAGKDDQWRRIDHWVGRLQPIRKMAFRNSVLGAFASRFGVEVPADAFYLARDDAPGLSGWQIGAMIYSVLLFAGMVYFFFIRPWRKRSAALATLNKCP